MEEELQTRMVSFIEIQCCFPIAFIHLLLDHPLQEAVLLPYLFQNGKSKTENEKIKLLHEKLKYF